MKHFTLLLSFFILFSLSFTCWFILLWDPNLLVAIGRALPALFGQSWGKLLFIAAGFITLGCSLSLFAMLVGIQPGQRQHVVYENENGPVGVSVDAIEEFVKRKGENVRGVRDLQVKCEIEESGLVVRNRVVLELQRNVPEFIHEFQNLIHHELSETLGLGNIKEVRVLIHKLFPKEGSKEPKLLTGPQQVLLKEEEDEADENIAEKNGSDKNITVIIPNEYKGKEHKG